MSVTPLFNPYVPTTSRDTMLDPFGIAEEEEEPESSEQPPADEKRDRPVGSKD